MKIAINFENLPKDGGAFHENILLTEVFKAFKGTKYKISYIVSNKEVKKILEEKDLDTLYFKKVFLSEFKMFYINLIFLNLF